MAARQEVNTRRVHMVDGAIDVLILFQKKDGPGRWTDEIQCWTIVPSLELSGFVRAALGIVPFPGMCLGSMVAKLSTSPSLMLGLLVPGPGSG
jgi:hypothetical protein